MERKEFIPIEITGSPKLIMRYYKSEIKSKDILVFVHGVSHGAWCWENFVEYYTKRGYACFVINLRGHGDDRNNKKGTLKKYVDDVKKCINRCEEYCKDNKIPYSKPYLIGHSMGGAIVEIYISEYSNKIKGAVLFAPATAQGMGKNIFTTTVSTTGFNTLPTTMGRKQNKHLSESNFFVAKDRNTKKFVPRITDETKLKYYDEQLCRESIFAMVNLWKFEITKPNIPVFVIGSDKDAYFPTDSLEITANFYDTKPMVLRGLCHDIMLDPEWEKAAESVLEFIENLNNYKQDSKKFIDNLEKKIYSPKDK